MNDKEKYWSAIIVGVIIILVFSFYYQLSFSRSDAGRIIGGISSIILRIVICGWISYIAKKQGRKPLGYVISAIFIPAFSLIIIGVIGNKKESNDN